MRGKLRNRTSIYITSGNKILLLYTLGSRAATPYWDGISGHFEKEEVEDAGAAALRKLKKEIHLEEKSLKNFSLKYLTLKNQNGEIRQNYYFFAELRTDAKIDYICDEGLLEWVPLSKVAEKIMTHTSKCVLQHYYSKGRRNKLVYCGMVSGGGVSLYPLEEFC